MITEIEDYFARGCGRCDRFATAACSTRRWHRGLLTLRDVCRGLGLVETVKWGQPCYTHAGRNVAIIGAFRGDFRLSFFHAGLLSDPAAVLERPGPNTAHPCMIRFGSEDDVAGKAPAIRALLAEAKSCAERGLAPPRPDRAPDLPAELAEALDCDPELAEAFRALTPGRRRSYVIHLAAARRPETRQRRIAGFRDRILAGRGATER